MCSASVCRPHTAGSGDDVERMKRLARPPAPLPQIFVKHLLPTGRVQAGRGGQHAIEIEEDGVEARVWKGRC